MMSLPRVKICGVTTKEQSKAIAQIGINYIGVIFHPPSKRFVELNTARAIAITAKENGAEPAGVFVDHNAEEITTICQQAQINIAQLHGKKAKESCEYLPEHLSRIYVVTVDKDSVICKEDIDNLSILDPKRDFLLFDSTNPGTGNVFYWEDFFTSEKNKKFLANGMNFFIAGGLRSENVDQLLQWCHPFAVDVSTGVESAPGIKDMRLVQQFLQTIHERTAYV